MSNLHQLEFVQESNCPYGSWVYPWGVTLNGATSQVCVDDTSASCAGQLVCDTPAPPNCTTVTGGFGMTAGNIYEFVVFQAERHVVNSDYGLTLRGFNAPGMSHCFH